MARRFRGRRGFKRNQQYGWASSIGEPFQTVSNDSEQVTSTILVAGDTDVDVTSVAGKHANVKRIVGDICWFPGFTSVAEVSVSEPQSYIATLCWFILQVDADDPTEYDPWGTDANFSEKILAHGLIPASQHYYVDTGGGGNNRWTTQLGESKTRVDVRSNRRLTSDENISLYFGARGSPLFDSEDVLGMVTWNIRTLLKFP